MSQTGKVINGCRKAEGKLEPIVGAQCLWEAVPIWLATHYHALPSSLLNTFSCICIYLLFVCSMLPILLHLSQGWNHLILQENCNRIGILRSK